MSTHIQSLPWENTKKPFKVLVVGDLILDEYIDGSVQRISPEAPVPVHLVSGSTITAGGAGNVARNIKLVGGEVEIIGLCGEDDAGKSLKSILESDGINTTYIIEDDQRPTTRKTRIRANQQQLIRVDWEKVTPARAEIQKRLLSNIEKSDAECILVSDYGKGCMPDQFIKDVIALGKTKNIPVVIDPKGSDFSKYAGCDYITPNRKEACDPLGIDHSGEIDPESIAIQLQKKFGLNNVLITLGADGMFYKSIQTNQSIKIPSKTREVFDVSGAGDTVAAIFSLAIAAKCEIAEAMKLATVAAGVVIEKLGTKPIYRDELISELSFHSEDIKPDDCRFKILSKERISKKAQAWRESGQTVVFTNGCFDILHAGHVSYLEKAKQLGDKLIIAINSDASIRRIKGEKRPINKENNRMHLISALGFVDAVCLFDEDTPEDIIRSIKPTVLVKGKDWDEDKIVGGEFVRANGGRVDTIDLVEGLSTSQLIENILTAYK